MSEKEKLNIQPQNQKKFLYLIIFILMTVFTIGLFTWIHHLVIAKNENQISFHQKQIKVKTI